MPPEPMKLDLLTSSSTELLVQMRWVGFRRLRLHLNVANDGAHVLATARVAPLDAIILESSLPDGDAFKICSTIKQDMGLEPSPLVIIVEKSLTREVLQKITASGCDEVLSSPLARGQIYSVLADHLNLPHRKHPRITVRSAVTAMGNSGALNGELVDLTIHGARLRLSDPIETRSSILLHIHTSFDEPLHVRGRVVWQKALGKGAVLAVQFEDISDNIAKQLEMLVNWNIEQRDHQQIVTLNSGLNERSSLRGLAPLLKGQVVFDLRHLLTITSVGLSLWVKFLGEIPDGVSYRFEHCSVAFCTQAGYLPEVLGRGKITSCFAPYFCRSCEYKEEREIDVQALVSSSSLEPPPMTCPSCSGELIFDDLPEEYFGYLE